MKKINPEDIKLDAEEQVIEDALERGEYVSVADADTTKIWQEAVKNYDMLLETKSITLRVNQTDLIKVKAKAKRNGLSYQTLINLLISQYVKGEIKIDPKFMKMVDEFATEHSDVLKELANK